MAVTKTKQCIIFSDQPLCKALQSINTTWLSITHVSRSEDVDGGQTVVGLVCYKKRSFQYYFNFPAKNNGYHFFPHFL